MGLPDSDAGKHQKRILKKVVQIEKKQRERVAKLKKKLQTARMRRRESDERNKDKLQAEINQVLQACIERINILQRDDLDLYERRKLAIEFKDFVDKYVNCEYRDNFYQFITHILQKYRTEEQFNQNEERTGTREEEAPNNHIEWPINCTHIRIAYFVWNSKKMRFSNPLEIAQRLKQYYYEETAHNEQDYDMTAQTHMTNYMGGGLPTSGGAANGGHPYVQQVSAGGADSGRLYETGTGHRNEASEVHKRREHIDEKYNSNPGF